MTVIVVGGASAPHREQYPDPERPILRITAGGQAIDRWQTGGWVRFVDAADSVSVADVGHLGRRLSRWDSNPTHAGLRSAGTRGGCGLWMPLTV
nr:hypothetical protein [Mycolicibacter minnesotensis]